jgi:hypothetical protein
MKKATKFVLIAAGPLLAAIGLGLSPTADAAFCTDPQNFTTGPFTQFLLEGRCQINGSDGIAVGRNAGGGQPKRLCSNLLQGNRATADGLTGISGGFIPGCRKHDSTPGNGEICDTAGCENASFHLLTVTDGR